jgi:hypothetical protein
MSKPKKIKLQTYFVNHTWKNNSMEDPSSLPSNWQATMKIIEQQWTKNQIGNMGTR